ncbi:VOC family protein [Lysinibacillus xylanilyticus]|uniref:VOC family protein n=1 Tax=Lysinibacillus xylanilyticus TaxID=582475 RepID=UPI0036DA56AF
MFRLLFTIFLLTAETRLTSSKNVLFNFFVKDIDEAYKFIENEGITVVREIERIGDFAYFNFQDLDGNVLMICNC